MFTKSCLRTADIETGNNGNKKYYTQAIKMGWGWGGADGQCIKLMGQSSYVILTWSKYFVNHLWPEGVEM